MNKTLTINLLLMFIGALVFIYFIIGVHLTPATIESGEAFIAKNMQPAVEFIEKSFSDNNALPTEEEFSTWKASKGWSNRDLSFRTINPSNGRFVLSAWRGEWHEDYFSWEKDYTADDSGIIYLIFYLLLSVVLFLVGFVSWRKTAKRVTLKNV